MSEANSEFSLKIIANPGKLPVVFPPRIGSLGGLNVLLSFTSRRLSAFILVCGRVTSEARFLGREFFGGKSVFQSSWQLERDVEYFCCV